MTKKHAPGSDDYEVGYKRPPQSGQFKKGTSGNPKGRPKKPMDLLGALQKAGRRPVIVRDSKGTRKIPALEAVLLKLVEEALKGRTNAAALIMKFSVWFLNWRQLIRLITLQTAPHRKTTGRPCNSWPKCSTLSYPILVLRMRIQKMDERTIDYASYAAAVRRENLYLFLHSAFSTLSPGKQFVTTNYLETLCLYLQGVALGTTTRVVVNMPPRHLKSVVATVVFPAWLLGRMPQKQVLVACYGDTLAREHSNLFRTLARSDFYRATFPSVWMNDTAGRLHEFRTVQGGGRRAVTLGGAVTGLGADIIIVDDIMKASDATSEARRTEVRNFFDSTLLSRLNDKRSGSIVAIQQRLHQDDLPAHLLEKDGYQHLNLPAIATKDTVYPLYYEYDWVHKTGTPLCAEREDLQTLNRIRQDIGEGVFETQYQQDPAAGGASMIDLSRLHLIDGKPSDFRLLKTVQTWDTAIKDNPDCDYSVCATFGWDGTRWLLVDVTRERLDFENLKVRAVQLRKAWEVEHVIVEDSANGSALVQDLRQQGFSEFTTMPVNEPKTARFAPAAEWLQLKKIGILHHCPWYPDLRRELVAFPNGRYDDQVDAIILFVKKNSVAVGPSPSGKNVGRGRHAKVNSQNANGWKDSSGFRIKAQLKRVVLICAARSSEKDRATFFRSR